MKISKILMNALILILAMVMLVGCKKENPSEVVIDYFNEIKLGNNIEINEYITEVLINQSDNEVSVDSIKNYDEFENLVCTKIDINILSENIKNDTAIVKVKLSGINVSNIILETLEQGIVNAFKGEQTTCEEIESIIIEKAKTSKVESRVGSIFLKRVDNKWQIDCDDEIIILIMGRIEDKKSLVN